MVFLILLGMGLKSHTSAVHERKMVLLEINELGWEVIWMAKWKFKGCPRCGGDLFVDKDMYGWYEQCLQCAYRCDLKELSKFQERRASPQETS